MADRVQCRRCQREAPGLEEPPPLPPELAAQVLAGVCGDCWQEWEAKEVMVINEHRLNFMDPDAPAVLHRHLREFLALDAPDG